MFWRKYGLKLLKRDDILLQSEGMERRGKCMTHMEKAMELLRQNYHCSQAVLGAFAGDFGLDLRTTLRISTCYGGGMRQETTCGCVTGGLLVLGLAFGFNDSQDRGPEACDNYRTEEYIRAFRERMHGDVHCGVILSRDIFIPEAMEAVRQESLPQGKCPRAFLASIEILEHMLKEHGGELLRA